MKEFLIRIGLGFAFVVLRECLRRLRKEKDFDRALRIAYFHAKAYDVLQISGPQKQAEVADLLRQDLQRLGIAMKNTMVNLAIELAVNKVRSEFGVSGHAE